MDTLSINIKENNFSYPIFINSDNFQTLKENLLNFCGKKKFIVIFSEKVFKLYGKDFCFGKENIFVLKDGENEKNIKNYQKIMDFILKKGLTREDFLIAIGGGVCGDLTGFVASTYMRGINFIQVPTTLLADVDSSVGGKTAINTDFGKNLIGSFYQPKAVFINTNFLKTLDEKQYLSGLGEVLKYSFIEKSCLCDEIFDLFNFLSEKKDDVFKRKEEILKKIIFYCIKLKKSVVEKDEKESGLRRILNFGHTYGHAVEKITNYKKYTHGQAVIEGIFFVFDLALKQEKINANYRFLAEDLLKKYGFKRLQHFPKEKIFYFMKKDKKVKDNEIFFVLPVEFAKVSVEKVSNYDLFL